MNDLFGQPINETAALAKPKRPKKTGHAAPIGTGPEGMKCKHCTHLVRYRLRSGRVFMKCKLMESTWTHGPGSDIKAKDKACSKFIHHHAQP